MCAIMKHQHLGIDSFILYGCPRVEVCARVAELLFPKLPIDPVTRELGPARIAGGS